MYISFKIKKNSNNLSRGQFSSDFNKNFYQQKQKCMLFSAVIFKEVFEIQFLNIHDVKTNFNHWYSNILSLYCVLMFEGLLKKTTFNSAFIDKNYQIWNRISFCIIFEKLWFKKKIHTSQKHHWRILFACFCSLIHSSTFMQELYIQTY